MRETHAVANVGVLEVSGPPEGIERVLWFCFDGDWQTVM